MAATPLPGPGWIASAQPGGEPLAEQGGGGAGGPPLRKPASISHLRFDPPSPDAKGIDISLTRVYAFRFGGGEIIAVPPPRPDEQLDRAGYGFDWKQKRVELLSWNPTLGGNHSRGAVRDMGTGDWSKRTIGGAHNKGLFDPVETCPRFIMEVR